MGDPGKSLLVPGKNPWAWQAAWPGPAGQMVCPVPGDIPVPRCQQSSHCSVRVPRVSVALPKAQGKFGTAGAQALSRHQGKLRHRGLHMCHATVTDRAVQLSHTALASPEPLQAPMYPNQGWLDVCLGSSADGHIRRVKPKHLPISLNSCSPPPHLCCLSLRNKILFMLDPDLFWLSECQKGQDAEINQQGAACVYFARQLETKLLFSQPSPSHPQKETGCSCADGSATTLALLVDSALEGQTPAVLLPSSSTARPSEGPLKPPFCY